MKSLRALLTIVSIGAFFYSHSQVLEMGAMGSLTGYYGDVNNEILANVNRTKQMRGGIFGYLRLHTNERLAIRANFGYLKVVGIDSLSSSQWQKDRNLNFYADIFEGSLQFELNLIPDRARGRIIPYRSIPYIFAGLGFTHFTPHTIYKGRDFNLAELNTSGVNYSQTTYCLPVGFGVRTYVNRHWIIGLEASMRFTGTNWLDDIGGTGSTYPNPANLTSTDAVIAYDRSPLNPPDMPPGSPNTWGYPGRQRGKINGNDLYYMIGITVGYKFSSVTTRGYQGKVRCPRFY